jgi:flagellar FliL protein
MANVADAPDVNDGGEGEEGAKPKSRFKLKLGKKQLIMAAGGLVVLLVLGGGAFLFLGGSHEEDAAHAEKMPAVFVDLPDMMVNLTAPSERPKYLKLKIALEVSDEKQAEQVRPLLPRVIDSFQTHLREMRPEDLDGSAGMYRLKEELLRRINQAVYPAKVDAILFKELLLQ